MAIATTDTASVLRVVIGEDDVLLREGVARLLTDAGLDVVAQAGDAQELLREALAHRPDVAIVDVRMPPHREHDGLVAAVELRRRLPRTGVLILSQFYEPSLALDLIGDQPEGVGYLLKERVGDVDTFVDAIGRVAAAAARSMRRWSDGCSDAGHLTTRCTSCPPVSTPCSLRWPRANRTAASPKRSTSARRPSRST